MEIITMEEKGYKQLITLVFEKLKGLLYKELIEVNNKLIQDDECHIKASKIQTSLADLLRQYNPEKTYQPIVMLQFKTKETCEQISKNNDKYAQLKISLNEKKEIIKCQLEAHCDRPMEQQFILENYDILKKGGRVAPVTISLLKSLLELPDDTELFGGADQ